MFRINDGIEQQAKTLPPNQPFRADTDGWRTLACDSCHRIAVMNLKRFGETVC
jgi:hypothetical protein